MPTFNLMTHNDYQKKYNREKREKGLCYVCKERALEGKTLCEKHLNNVNEKSIALTQRYKRDVMEHYGGGRCSCCGEINIAFLSIDHINNDGHIHRKKIFGKNVGYGGRIFYRWLIKNNYPEDLQVLCFNCNWGKHHNNGICPHKVKK